MCVCAHVCVCIYIYIYIYIYTCAYNENIRPEDLMWKNIDMQGMKKKLRMNELRPQYNKHCKNIETQSINDDT